jgi:hypothetical protein
MAQQSINTGTTANDGTGDTLRAAGLKINANFTEVYSNIATINGSITANAASANSVINTTVSANVATINGSITANAASANSVINTRVSANVSTLRSEISSNISTITVFSQAAFNKANNINVDLSTQLPSDQQGLVWLSANNTFVPGTGDLIKTAALIDVTSSGSSSYLFDSHYTGNNPTLYFRPGQTYAFRLNNIVGHPFHLQTVSGAYSSANAYTTGLTHVSLTGAVTTGAYALLKVSGILYCEVPSNTSTSIFYVCQNHSAMAGKIVIGNITETATGDGSTTLTINSGRNVNDLLVFVNGSCLRPTTDYTVTGTTLTFTTAPTVSANIVVRYL